VVVVGSGENRHRPVGSIAGSRKRLQPPEIPANTDTATTIATARRRGFAEKSAGHSLEGDISPALLAVPRSRGPGMGICSVQTKFVHRTLPCGLTR
jgi:hypothetical protein